MAEFRWCYGVLSGTSRLICHFLYLSLGIASKTAHVFLDFATELSGGASNAIFIHVCLADENEDLLGLGNNPDRHNQVRQLIGLLPLAQTPIASDQVFCHCCAICIYIPKGLNAAICATGQLPVGLKLEMDCSFDSIADDELGDLICSSQASISRSVVWTCILMTSCICAWVASTICCGHPSARAAAAILSMTIAKLSTVTVRQVDIASNAAFTALRASSESSGDNLGLKSREVSSANLLSIACFPSLTARR